MGNIFDKNKIIETLLILSWVVFLFICIGLLSFTSHAEESFFPMQQNENGHFTETYLNAIDNTFNSEDNYIFVSLDQTYNGAISYVAFVFPKSSDNMIFGEIYSNGYQFSLYSNGSITGGATYYGFLYDNGQIDYYSHSFQYFTGLNSSLYSSSSDYVSNFKVYTNNSENASVVLKYGSDDPLPIGQGHATVPDPFEDPTLANGSNHTLPREVPESPIINNYTWITYNPPSIDTTNLESLLESLIYVINYLAGWLRDNLAGEFQNLISNIKDLFEYIGNTIQYYGGLIISNIQNGIETFYNNMVSLFEPISAKIDYFTEPVDGTIIYDNISSTSLVTNINTINSSLTAFQTSFSNLSEPSSFTIPIHLENLPSAYFGNQTTQYIDLGVIGSTEKTLIRTFMWALITYGLFITIVDSVSNYINGGGDES